jgi:hypothetical protein
MPGDATADPEGRGRAQRSHRRSHRVGLRSAVAGAVVAIIASAVTPLPSRAAAPGPVIASDTFTRGTTNGWGTADVGGSYERQGSGHAADGSGSIQLASPAANAASRLPAVNAQDVELAFSVSTSKLATGAPVFAYAEARQAGFTANYRLKVRFGVDRGVYLQASRVIGGSESVIGTEARVGGLVHSAGISVRVRARVTGVNPTTLLMRAWADGQAEPSSWTYQTSDSTAALQSSGSLGLRAYLSRNATNAPLSVRFDDWTVWNVAANAPAGQPATLVAAGDIAGCGSNGDDRTAALLDGIPGTVVAIGDLVYENGTTSEFSQCYASNWGRHRARTRPAAGNHEYNTAGAAGYFGYFGPAAGESGKGWYAFGLGQWRVYVLNSNCAAIGGCHAGSTQEQWLRRELAADPSTCVLAVLHHPRFSSAGGNAAIAPLWQALYDYRADVLLTGHAHFYERFAPQSGSGVRETTRGIRQFVVGTGGRSLNSYGSAATNSEIRSNSSYGVLKLTLRTSGYDWQFVPVAGSTFTDSGSGTCV